MPIEHIVQEGESTISLSEQFGLFAKTIWDDPANAELKKKRKDMNVLMPGDKIVIPDKRLKEVSKPDGKAYKFLRKGVPALFRLQLFDGEKPRANQKYTLVIDGKKLSGQTDANGVLEQHLPTDAVEGELIIGPDNFRCELSFGQLNPADEIIGIQQRLRNLGFDCGEPSGEMDAATVEALLAFQRRFGLKTTGKADEATLEKLRKLHDSDEKFPDDIKTA